MRTELRRRDAILGAVRTAAERFLDPSTTWFEAIPDVLEGLARAAGASRTYLFENVREEDDEVWTSQRFEWCAPGVVSYLDNETMRDLPLVATGWSRWADLLRRGETVVGRTAELPARERPELQRQEILSIALVPVTIEGAWWGFIGFDDCHDGRGWGAGEIDALRAAASTIGAAIRATRVQAELRAREQEYRAVFAATGDGLVITDLDSRVVAANPAFHAMHGYPEGAMVGLRTADWLAPSDAGLPRRFAEEGTLRTDALDRCEDGSTFPVEITADAFTFRGEPHVLGVVRDVTERHRTRRLLTDRLDALAQGASSLTVDASLGMVLDDLAALAVSGSSGMAATVELVEADLGGLQLLGSYGLSEDYRAALAEVRRRGVVPPTIEALRARRSVLERGLRSTALSSEAYAPLHAELRKVAWEDVLVLPLDTSERYLGALNVGFPPGHEPTTDERAFLRAVADLAAAAIVNEQLYASARGQAQLEERQRLARDLHDSVSQALYGIALGARTARTLAAEDPTRAMEPLEYVLDLAEAGLTEMRALIFELRPEALASEGLRAALERQVRAVRARHGLLVEYTADAEPDLPLSTKEAIYRIVQEALHNVVKHAEATAVTVTLQVDGDVVAVRVDDDGGGFHPDAAHPGHLGLHSMRERAAAAGGTCEIVSAVGAGTTLTVTVPLDPTG